MSDRTFLFLQGHPSPFARELAAALVKHGQTALHINLCAGDWLYWHGTGTWNFRGRFDDWREYLKAFSIRHRVTDIVYYSDRRPYHVVAAAVADELGIDAYAYEFGYLRPGWITLERRGMGAFSHFPDQTDKICQIADRFPTPDLKSDFKHSVYFDIAREALYALATFYFYLAYPFYKTDWYYNPVLEYLVGLPQFFLAKGQKAHADALLDGLARSKTAYFVVPLQLQSDYQLRANSGFRDQAEMIGEVVLSFARSAPHDSASRLQDLSFGQWLGEVGSCGRQNISGRRRSGPC